VSNRFHLSAQRSCSLTRLSFQCLACSHTCKSWGSALLMMCTLCRSLLSFIVFRPSSQSLPSCGRLANFELRLNLCLFPSRWSYAQYTGWRTTQTCCRKLRWCRWARRTQAPTALGNVGLLRAAVSALGCQDLDRLCLRSRDSSDGCSWYGDRGTRHILLSLAKHYHACTWLRMPIDLDA